jgi:hypothetical protein
MTQCVSIAATCIGALLVLAGCSKSPAPPASAAAEPAASMAKGPAPTPFPERVLWGDEHVHTGWSADAGLAGTTLSPEDAVRFVRGETVKSNTGQDAKLEVPLDWVAVTDHSDGMGTISELQAGNPEFMADPRARAWAEAMKKGGVAAHDAAMEAVSAQSNKNLPKVFMDPKWMASAWTKTIDIMEKYNEPGKFTAFIAYEWTSNAGGGNNLHRNVIFRDNGDKARQVLPLTTSRPRTQPDFGNGWRPTRPRPAASCWRSRITAISRTAGCSRSASSTARP